MRGINETFIRDLQTGCLKEFLEAVVRDDRLWMGIRKNYINIYYCGGNAVRIQQKGSDYKFFFDINYCNNKTTTRHRDKLQEINFSNPVNVFDVFPYMLEEMDSWFEVHPKPERTFQYSLLANNPQILDIEYAGKTSQGKGFRLDMLAVTEDGIIIVENKFGNTAIGGKAGLAKHHNDIRNILEDHYLKMELIKSVKRISENKVTLGISETKLTKEQFEILLLLANYTDKGKALKNQIELMDRAIPSKILMMDSDEVIMDLTKARSI